MLPFQVFLVLSPFLHRLRLFGLLDHILLVLLVFILFPSVGSSFGSDLVVELLLNIFLQLPLVHLLQLLHAFEFHHLVVINECPFLPPGHLFSPR